MSHVAPGDEIDGRYRVVERLGAGAMGVVYRADDVWLDRPVAIKLVSASPDDDEASGRFMREARALAQVRHDNVVSVYAYGVHDGAHYFAMEYVDGVSLEAMVDEASMRGEVLDLARGLSLLGAIARGLGAVHRRGLVHRDVKPANVVVEHGSGRPVLVDFGLARTRSAFTPRGTTSAGTPAYMAPEQAQDGVEITPAADVYAFACTAFEVFTGRPVFTGDVYDILESHAFVTPPRVSALVPALAGFDAAFARALAKSPSFRHPSCEAFVDELTAASRPMLQSRSAVSIRPGERGSLPDAVRVFVLEPSPGLARQIVRTADRAIGGCVVECFTDEAALRSAFSASPADVVILDAEGLVAPAGATVRALRELGGADAGVILLRRDWDGPPSELRALGVRELPKPINMGLLTSALRKAAPAPPTPPAHESCGVGR